MGDNYMKQCEKGHFYDDNRFESCPYCKEGTGLGKQVPVSFQNQPAPQFQSAPAQPVAPIPAFPNSGFKFCTKCGNRAEANAKFCTGCGNPFPAAAPAPSSDIGKTVAVQQAPVTPSSDIGKTVAVTPMAAMPSSDIGKTVALNTAPAPAPISDIGKTVAVKPIDLEALTGSKSAVAPAAAPIAPVNPVTEAPRVTVAPPAAPAVPAAPVAAAPVAAVAPVTEKPQVTVAPQKAKPAKTKPVAFLVCISGKNLGDSFIVSDGRNYIAGGADADIRLDKDPEVSAECHAVVTYNPSNNKFTLSAGTGRGITYLNGEQIDVSSDINADDRIKVGSSELLFIPVCTDKFKWESID